MLLIIPLLIYSTPLENMASEGFVQKVAYINVQDTDSSQAVELGGTKTIILREVRYSGNDVITTEELNRLAKPFLHRPFSQKELRELEGRIKVVYKGKGYKNLIIDAHVQQHYQHFVLFIDIQEGPKDYRRDKNK